MFHGEMTLEVERRLQQACDDRARAGLPPPVSIDALRAMVRGDLLAEIEAKRLAPKIAALKATPSPKPAVVLQPTPMRKATPAPPPSNPTPPKATGMALLIEMAGQVNSFEPVFPSLRSPVKAPSPKPAVDSDEMAARAILEAGRIARGL